MSEQTNKWSRSKSVKVAAAFRCLRLCKHVSHKSVQKISGYDCQPLGFAMLWLIVRARVQLYLQVVPITPLRLTWCVWVPEGGVDVEVGSLHRLFLSCPSLSLLLYVRERACSLSLWVSKLTLVQLWRDWQLCSDNKHSTLYPCILLANVLHNYTIGILAQTTMARNPFFTHLHGQWRPAEFVSYSSLSSFPRAIHATYTPDIVVALLLSLYLSHRPQVETSLDIAYVLHNRLYRLW